MSPTMQYTNRHIRRRFRSLLGQREQATDVLLQTGISKHRQEQRVRRGSAGYKVEQSVRDMWYGVPPVRPGAEGQKQDF